MGMKKTKYTVNYGYGVATLVTPFDFKERFETLANVCPEIAKRRSQAVVMRMEDVTDEWEHFESLGFFAPTESWDKKEYFLYVWREDGARKLVTPVWKRGFDSWNERYCDICGVKKDANGV